jgi:hypothetical protein
MGFFNEAPASIFLMDNNTKAVLPADQLLSENFPPISKSTKKRQSAVFQHIMARLCLVVMVILSVSAKAHSQTMNYTVQANIIYRFTKYIDWPIARKSGDFVIGIVGETPLYAELKNFATNKMAGTQKIVIRKFSSSAEAYNCQILFIGEDESGSLKKIVARTAGSSILLVTESEGLAQKGACINFIIVSDHLRLEINKSNIEMRNLNIASELVQLGIAIK